MYNCPYMTNEKNEILKDKNYACYYPADIKKIHHLTINDINVCMCSF